MARKEAAINTSTWNVLKTLHDGNRAELDHLLGGAQGRSADGGRTDEHDPFDTTAIGGRPLRDYFAEKFAGLEAQRMGQELRQVAATLPCPFEVGEYIVARVEHGHSNPQTALRVFQVTGLEDWQEEQRIEVYGFRDDFRGNPVFETVGLWAIDVAPLDNTAMARLAEELRQHEEEAARYRAATRRPSKPVDSPFSGPPPWKRRKP